MLKHESTDMKIQKLHEYIEHFKTTELWAEMVNTVEDSPWHREANVSVHTEMVLDQFFTHHAPHLTENEVVIGALALLYHDVGKPPAEEEISREDGTKYRRYAGHEPISANVFIQSYVTDARLRELISIEEATAARWIIEHHLPYGVKAKQKRIALRTATARYFEMAGVRPLLFAACLKSDAAGRISDDHEEKLKAVDEWIQDFADVEVLCHRDVSVKKHLILLMGGAGAGKSTFVALELKGPHDVVLSYDAMKLKFFSERFPDSVRLDPKEMYELARHFCTLGDGYKEFDKVSRHTINSTIKDLAKVNDNVLLFSDTVNSTKKRRVAFVQPALQHGFRVTAVDFIVPIETLVARQSTRPDKQVPESAIRFQVMGMSLPLLGTEVDSYHVILQPKE